MKRAQAQAAIDDAFADGLKKLFGVLVANLTTDDGPDEAAKRFATGVEKNDDAYARASAAIERIFPE